MRKGRQRKRESGVKGGGARERSDAFEDLAAWGGTTLAGPAAGVESEASLNSSGVPCREKRGRCRPWCGCRAPDDALGVERRLTCFQLLRDQDKSAQRRGMRERGILRCEGSKTGPSNYCKGLQEDKQDVERRGATKGIGTGLAGTYGINRSGRGLGAESRREPPKSAWGTQTASWRRTTARGGTTLRGRPTRPPRTARRPPSPPRAASRG